MIVGLDTLVRGFSYSTTTYKILLAHRPLRRGAKHLRRVKSLWGRKMEDGCELVSGGFQLKVTPLGSRPEGAAAVRSRPCRGRYSPR